MRTAVIYYSETGNTARVAGAIAAALRDATSVDTAPDDRTGDKTILGSMQDAPALDGCDLVFVGMPIVRFGAPEAVQHYLAEHCAGRRVALFVTHTAPDYLEQLPGWLDACCEAVTGAELVGFFHCQGALAEPVRQFMLGSGDPMLTQFAEMASCADSQPDDAALARAAEFARETAARERAAQAVPVAVAAPAAPALSAL